MSAKTHTWIQLTAATIASHTLTFTFKDHTSRNFSILLDYDQDVEQPLQAYPQDKIQRLLNYIGLTQAMYFFNFEYYKEVVGLYQLNDEESAFFSRLYFAGLAEFRYNNHIPLKTEVSFSGTLPLETIPATAELPTLHGALVTNGGGKDGATAAEIANAVLHDLSWFSLNKRGKRQQIIDASPFQSQISVARTITPLTTNQKYTGHKATNGDIGMQAVLAALVMRKKYIVVGNEYSANEANLVHDSVGVNHQYTKSFTFEMDLAKFIDQLGVDVHYFSMVRPLYELQILRIFENYPAYHKKFVSCNHGVHEGYWCLSCAKCAFVILSVTALSPAMAQTVWGDRFILAKPELREHITALVSDAIDKPFECVGTLDECQLALGMIYRNQTFFRQLPGSLQELISQHQPTSFDTLYNDLLVTFDRENNIPSELRPAVYNFLARHLN